MITHKVIDKLGIAVYYGSLQECKDYKTGANIYDKIVKLTTHEIQFYNSYDLALRQGEQYIKSGNIKSFK